MIILYSLLEQPNELNNSLDIVMVMYFKLTSSEQFDEKFVAAKEVKVLFVNGDY